MLVLLKLNLQNRYLALERYVENKGEIPFKYMQHSQTHIGKTLIYYVCSWGAVCLIVWFFLLLVFFLMNFVFLSVDLSVRLSVYISIRYLSACLSVCFRSVFRVFLFVFYLSAYLTVCQFICLSVCLLVCLLRSFYLCICRSV